MVGALAVGTSGCFSPDDPEGTSGTSSGGSSETSNGPGSDPGTTTTDDPPTTDPSAGTTTDPEATGSETTAVDPTDPSDPTVDDTTGAPDPYCGDGEVGDDEACDDGDDNGEGQACNADCQLNVCGDGDPGPDEGCDDGDDNALMLGACAPDCSGMIEERRITFSDPLSNGNFGNDPIGFADSHCQPGYAAMFSFANLRRASFSPLMGDVQVDWVLRPYTAYTNDDSELVWVTDESGLLGVRDGMPMPLINGVEDVVCEGQCPLLRMITGMNADWTTLSDNTCGGWSNTSGMASIGMGNHLENYIANTVTGCSPWVGTYFYCVQQ